MNKEEIAKKIAKLLALSKSNNPHEAELAVMKAKELMDAHGMTMSEAEVHADGIKEHHIDIYTDNPDKPIRFLALWQKYLVSTITAHFDVESFMSYYSKKGKNKGTKVVFVGTTTDVQVAEYVFNYLIREINRLADIRRKSLKDEGYKGNVWSYLNSYRVGLVSGLRAKLYEEKRARATAKTTDGHELVVVKNAMIKAHMKGIKLSSQSGTCANVDYEARTSGHQDGKNISVNRGVSGGGTKGPLALR